MDALLSGIKYGLFLTILVGPLVFALIQTGVERGFRAGTMIGFGIWISDLLFIFAVYYGFSHVKSIIEWEYFELTVGIIGGIILMITGVFTLISKTPDINKNKKITGTYLMLWIKGFIINTLNPFTVFFWVLVMTTVVANNNYSPHQSLLYFGGILGTIMLTDSLKVLLAKRLRHYLEVHHLTWVRRVTGVALFIFGVVLIGRVII
ncbi:MAG: threonine/homoserine/homoserine lactone efflux protein [Saprospiraceae bacterium]|jgi:threonine/homoserine/homoserine lactone efflux protein